jgi:hypothetical protein
MDVLAHFLWSVALFWNQRHRLYAGLFGVLPDLLTFTPFLLGELGHLRGHGAPAISTIPSYVFMMYNVTHSIIVWVVLFSTVWIIMRKPPVILGAWGVHILCDLFTHEPGYFLTPIFWPISSWHYTNGVRWSTPTFMIINYSALAIVYLLILKHTLAAKTAQSIKRPSRSNRR